MNNAFKIGLYVVLTIAALWFGIRFYSEYKKSSEAAAQLPLETTEAAAVKAPETPTQNTNEPPASPITQTTNEAGATTNVVVDTNEIANAALAATNASTEPNAAVVATTTNPASVQTVSTVGKGKWMRSLGGFLGVLILLGLLIAYDVTQFFGNRTVDFFFNDDLKGVHNPEYEEAEALWTNGKPLEAIQAMREYLKKNPREQYVALRIAEIYEKDLRNYLAAALEYEQVLQHKLPRERWGWAAIHLCNLYSKLGKNDQCVALLRRIESEYSETAAAKKARKRLAMFESVGDATSLGMDAPEDPTAPAEIAPPPQVRAAKAKTEEPASNLPPGFRPKK